jgi:hypothetical protein
LTHRLNRAAMRLKRAKPEPEPYGPPDDGTVRFLLMRPSPLPECERYTVRLPKINIDLECDAAERLACDLSRSLRRAGLSQTPSVVLDGEEVEVARIAIGDAIKVIDWHLREIDPNNREDLDNRETLLSIPDDAILRFDFDQARTLMNAIEELHGYEDEIGRPDNFYYDDDRFNQLLVRLQDATSPGSSHPTDLDGIIWP